MLKHSKILSGLDDFLLARNFLNDNFDNLLKQKIDAVLLNQYTNKLFSSIVTRVPGELSTTYGHFHETDLVSIVIQTYSVFSHAWYYSLILSRKDFRGKPFDAVNLGFIDITSKVINKAEQFKYISYYQCVREDIEKIQAVKFLETFGHRYNVQAEEYISAGHLPKSRQHLEIFGRNPKLKNMVIKRGVLKPEFIQREIK